MPEVVSMGKYKPYPSYKDSGVEWLGDVPENWQLNKLRYCFSFSKGLTITKANLQDDGIPCVNYGEVHSKFGFEVDTDRHSLKCVNSEYLESSKGSLIHEGDFVFADTSEDLEGSGNFTQLISKEPIFAGYHTIIARPVGCNDKRYLAYSIDSMQFRTQIQLMVKGVKVFSITQAILKNASLWLPSFLEQKSIAHFLDQETGKMDLLIEKQQAMIALLKEKRQAVISHAVTKGLNPNSPLKDSGIKWLGQIPEHWELSNLRYIFKFGKGLTITKVNLQDEGIPCVSYGEVHSKFGFEVSTEKHHLKCVSRDFLDTSKFALLKQGDFVFADTSEDFEGAGNFTHVSSSSLIFAGYHTIIAKQIYEHNYRFLAYVMDSTVFRTQIQLAVKGVKVFSITQAILRAATIWLPEVEEQEEIASYLDSQTQKIDTLIEKSQQAIALLKERKTALISAAVTGKIDVRGFN
ncbi:MAG: restriction endonuclease subunit S [Thiomicrorhabdus chilensis]|uniref:restriction endonuclease subunit S n=1 Tax=Thiomicrorhabdus chilensis TaxID=63656 RepID=UPI00299F2EE0|nr:restriction endonuclease subunit S [Thiomicrorhabdus chilensis]MDX1346978.1 restriction endonuclease subunit S [Thiomicrorhabdus chilensis]